MPELSRHARALMMQQEVLSRLPEDFWKPYYAGIPWMDKCPFCGKEPVFKDKTECAGHGDYYKVAYVVCSGCGAMGPTVDDYDWPIAEMRRNMAILRWNCRKEASK